MLFIWDRRPPLRSAPSQKDPDETGACGSEENLPPLEKDRIQVPQALRRPPGKLHFPLRQGATRFVVKTTTIFSSVRFVHLNFTNPDHETPRWI